MDEISKLIKRYALGESTEPAGSRESDIVLRIEIVKIRDI